MWDKVQTNHIIFLGFVLFLLSIAVPAVFRRFRGGPRARNELPTPAPGSMCYMMSKQAYFGDSEPPLSHLMFELPPLDAAAWGANLPGSPVILGVQGVSEGAPEPMTEFVVPVGKWSDGTPAAADDNSASESCKH